MRNISKFQARRSHIKVVGKPRCYYVGMGEVVFCRLLTGRIIGLLERGRVVEHDVPCGSLRRSEPILGEGGATQQSHRQECEVDHIGGVR